MNNNKYVNEESKKPKLSLQNIFYHNTFVLIFSFVCAVVIWFTLAASNALGKPRAVYDVPINIQLSEAAQAEGVRAFFQTDKQARVSITGSNWVVNEVTADDLSVVAKLTPTIIKLAGNTMQTETIDLVATKQGNNLADYEVVDVVPRDITVMYDRYKESTFTIENNLKYAAAGNKYFIPTPVISETQVVVSGPESSVNRVSRVSLDYEIREPISESRSLSISLTAYDQSNQPITQLSDLYLTLSVDTVEVVLTVLGKQTVALDVTTLNVPEGFSESRITIDPESIDIAGDPATVSKYMTLTLPGAIDFSKINTKNFSFENVEIPMPAGVQNVSNITTANVAVNLNGFQEASLNVDNLKFVNVPETKEVTLLTKSLQVDVVGSAAQISRLTPASIFGTIDMAKLAETNGNIEVPVTVSISGSTSCWVYGQYTVHATVQDKVVAPAEVSSEASPAS